MNKADKKFYLNKNNLVGNTSNLSIEGIVLKHSELIINLT